MILRLLFGLILFCVTINQSQAQRRFVIENPNTPTRIFDKFSTALGNLQDGDIFYLPGGIYPGFQIDETNVTIIGAGHYPDSTQATQSTIVTNTIELFGDSIHLTGIDGANNAGVAVRGSHCTVSRCHVTAIVIIGGQGVDYPIIMENVIQDDIIGGNSNTGLIIGNIIGGRIFNLLGADIVIKNNIFLHSSLTHFHAVTNTTIEKNIFNKPFLNITSGTSDNNLFIENSFMGESNALDPYFEFEDNIFIDSYPAVTFLGGNLAETFDYEFDYHIASALPVGIYVGGYKDGALPFNPHISEAIIADTLNQDGKLRIQIKVTAQEN